MLVAYHLVDQHFSNMQVCFYAFVLLDFFIKGNHSSSKVVVRRLQNIVRLFAPLIYHVFKEAFRSAFSRQSSTTLLSTPNLRSG